MVEMTPAVMMSIAGAAMSGINTVVSGAQGQRQAKAQAANAAAEAASRAQQIQQAQAIESERRQRALKEALATKRARMGASGVQSTGGSGRAVLLGLIDKAAEEEENSSTLTGLRLAEVERQASATQQRSLLEASGGQARMALGLGNQLFNAATPFFK